ncbi:MAG TPA: hypothetical protein VFF76_04720 [Holophagaceae bacterium]|jgi:hypothetical protein|nr:hypothetical protein [Holophagaceae bacterium]
MTSFSKFPLLFLALPLAAQGTRMPLQDAPAHRVLVDDDDGKVEIVPSASSVAPEAARKFHGGAILASPQIYTVYYGTAWSSPQHAAPMRRMNDGVTAFGVSERFAALKPQGLDAFSFPVVNEGIAPTLPSQGSVTDLGLQHFLHGSLRARRLHPPTGNSLVVIFLAPGIRSTLNGKPDGLAFQAYHSAYHDEAGLMRYVVVPFGASEESTRNTAEQAITAAILNPDGDGWY